MYKNGAVKYNVIETYFTLASYMPGSVYNTSVLPFNYIVAANDDQVTDKLPLTGCKHPIWVMWLFYANISNN